MGPVGKVKTQPPVPDLPRRGALARLCTFVLPTVEPARVEGRRSGGRHRTWLIPFHR
jgi:hypothetical protein